MNMLIVLAALAASTPATASEARTYSCSRPGSLEVRFTRTTAFVNFERREYQLHRKRSSIGVRYGSPSAALMLDGQFAVFVTEGSRHAVRCSQVGAMARRR
jgi:hypothetical protein